jgi:formiminoglutamate deiminase
VYVTFVHLGRSTTIGVVTAYWCERAWLSSGVRERVRVDTDDAGVVTAVEVGEQPEPPDMRLPGIVVPGFANAHSHAFHRALRGRTHGDGGTFWSWRERMYAAAARLDPDSYRRLATAVYAEMALAGVSCVGEFHYVHHQADGTPYDDPNAMGEAVREAATAAGIRLTLLDTCYLSGGFGKPLSAAQLRFGDGDAERWAERVAFLRPDATTRIGVAIHSVRAVPAEQMPTVVAASSGRPLHIHVSEQPAENEECLDAYAATPTQLLQDHGVLGPATTAIHATHLTPDDVALLGGQRTTVCLCPTTERDLADGIGAMRKLVDAGASLSLGSDSHAVIDMFEEARAVELDERLASGERGRHRAADLLRAASAGGHSCLGWPDAGRIEQGARADLVTVGLDSVRLAGTDPGTSLGSAVFAASATDVRHVIVDGKEIVKDGVHTRMDVPRELDEAIRTVMA